jgi:predicted O-methyltransferase YrrM
MSALDAIALLFVLLGALAGNIVVVLYLRHKHRLLYSRFDRLERTIWEAQALGNLVRPRAPLPQPGGWAASVDFLAEVVRLIETRRPALVVELGSGLSTIVIALKLAELGSGRLVSIDHDATFAADTARRLEAHGVRELVDIRIAPLATDPDFAPETPWYSTAHISDLSEIDLLVIDGPPMPVHPLVRRPALVFFRHRMNPHACIILDDAARDGERSIIEDWREIYPEISVQEISLDKGAAVITCQAAT